MSPGIWKRLFKAVLTATKSHTGRLYIGLYLPKPGFFDDVTETTAIDTCSNDKGLFKAIKW
ncbi:MAG: hypothetical protein KAR20_19800 [Candidatus Heimdallarchaeota archaeon]|nr:hypothetical protein [Candidatus Heimdallarchaeota archaeon]